MSEINKQAVLLVDAVAAYFLHKKTSAQANLENYLNNSSGIGEHAESCLSIVDNYKPALSIEDSAMV